MWRGGGVGGIRFLMSRGERLVVVRRRMERSWKVYGSDSSECRFDLGGKYLGQFNSMIHISSTKLMPFSQ